MHLVPNPTQTLPQTLPCSLNIPPYSLHSLQHRRSRRRKPNLFDSDWESDWESLPKKRGTTKKGKKDSDSGPLPLPPFDSWWWPADTVPPPPYPPNTVLFNTEYGYDRALNKIKDERLPSVLFFTAYGCKKTSKWIHPFFPELCEQFKHITIYVFPLPPQPTFQFYLNGEKVEEISTRSIKRVIKTFENVYNPSGMKKRGRRQGSKQVKNEEEVDPSKLTEVLPSRFPVLEIQIKTGCKWQLLAVSCFTDCINISSNYKHACCHVMAKGGDCKLEGCKACVCQLSKVAACV
ncbi:uncharacterized protein [Malus domestica]|uniref:uncharacterized protein isoform X2 n=1 Tax=Malus domestica TaxID=3750 RepID=UPI0039765745